MMARQIPDRSERGAALDPGRSFICQAPAGAGKTGLLTQRFLRLLATVDEPEEILAITFTRKAATEMRNRILGALRDATAGKTAKDDYARLTLELAASALARNRERGWALTDNPGRLQVRTIDSLCHGLARRLPLLSRSGGPTLAMDDAGELYRLAARHTLALVDDPDFGVSVSALLGHLDNNPARAEGMLTTMLARRDQWLRHLGGDRHERISRTQLETSLRRLVDETFDRLADTLPIALAPAFWELMHFARDHIPEDKRDNPLGRWDGVAPVADDGGDRQSRWLALAQLLLTRSSSLRSPGGLNKNTGFPAPGKDASLKSAKDRMGEILGALHEYPLFVEQLAKVDALPVPEYGDNQWQLLEQLPSLLNLAYAQLRLIFAERGVTDHTEVNAAAGLALGTEEEPTDLALALDYKLRHILVDEFQDTSRTQFDLLRRLTAGWQPGDGHSFFAVGDPMQSIYRFRQAEVGLFIETRDRGLGDLPLDSLVLQTNFRSASQIIDWVNATFSTVFPEKDDCDRGAIRYAAAEAFHGAAGNSGVQVHPLFDDDKEQEARVAVDLIREAMDDGRETIAVLARSRTHLHPIATELTQRGIPYQAVDVQRLGDRLAVRELRALVRALVLPEDRAAWLAVLRAPWCGLTLADLTALAGDDPHTEIVRLLAEADRLKVLSADGADRATRAHRILNEALVHRRRRGLRETVEAVWLSLGGPACLQSETDLAAAQAFLDLLSEYESSADLPLLQRLDEALDSLYAPPDPSAPPRVQLMTVHKAKGLEFDTVILPGLGRPPRGNERELVQWLEWEGSDGASHFVLAPIAESEDGQDPLEQLLRRTEKEKQELETARLLYVAATRARKSLHLIGTIRPTDDPEKLAPRRDTLLHPLWPVVGSVFRQALTGAAPDSENRNDGAGEETAAPPLVRAFEPWVAPSVAGPCPN